MKKRLLTLLSASLISITSQAQTWTLQGSAPSGTTKFEISDDNIIYALGAKITGGNIYSRAINGTSFSILAGNGEATDISAQYGTLYVIGGLNTASNCNIYKYNNSAWGLLSPAGALSDLDFDGTNLVGCNSAGNAYSLNTKASSPAWASVAGGGVFSLMTKVADQTFVGARADSSFINRGTRWVKIKNSKMFTCLSGGSFNSIWALAAGVPYQYNYELNTWEQRQGSAFSYITTSSKGEVWALGIDGNLYKASYNNTPVLNAGASFVSGSPINSAKVEVGSDGSIYVIGNHSITAGNIYYASRLNTTTFSVLPNGGTVFDLAAEPTQLWGTGVLSNGNNVYKFTKSSNSWGNNSPAGELSSIDFDGSYLVGCSIYLTSGNNFYTQYLQTSGNNYISGNKMFTLLSANADGSRFASYKDTIYAYLGGIWSVLSTDKPAAYLASSAADNTWMISNGDIYRLDPQLLTWKLKYAAGGFINTISPYKSSGVDELWATGIDGNLYKFDNVVTSSQDQISEDNTWIYPNPASSYIQTSEGVQIFDLMGNKVLEGSGKMDVSSMSPGLYIAKGQNKSTKIMIR